MALSTGTRLGPYEITATLGAGGMGEVYRARDTKLQRDVAIKVIGAGFTHDPERAARLEREAQLLAALNHPHIASIYGLEQEGDSQFLVMELVEGETLADRLRGSALELDESVRIATQVADALQAAHDKGIIHRDLKPANIALTAEEQVKVLDFGLAKLTQASGPGPQAPDMTASPTLSVAATQSGMILGTAAYMSPEQARGKPADKRSDIWAFGCVLFEMLTGQRAFDGEDVAVVLASVIKGEPDWTALPSQVPKPIATLLRGCLEKERRNRIADIGVASFVLTKAAHLVERVEMPAVAAAPARSQSLWRWLAPVGAGLGAGALLAGASFWVLRPDPPRVVRTTLTTSGSSALVFGGADRDIAITPDGSRVVYRGNGRLLVLLSRLTTHLAQDVRPLWTLDGRTIIFTSNRDGYPAMYSRRADGTSRDERLMARATDLAELRGTGWSPDGKHLLFQEVTTRIQCWFSQIATERPSDATLLLKDEFCNGWPAVSPDGRWIAYESNRSGRVEIYVEGYPVLGSRQQVSTSGGRLPLWSRDGRELFFRSVDDRQIFRVPIRSGTTLDVGRPQVLFEFPMLAITGGMRPYDVAPDGTFIIIRGAETDAAGAPNLILVQNWFEELKRLVPN